jgi:DNA modification methylase
MKAYNSDITIEEFVARHATPYDPETDNYFREPFARDTKVGKNSAIYNAHSYHTKVPPEGIVPYILHYTEPGDLVLDPFCGSGMTGVAAMMCAQATKGVIVPAGAKLGARKAILNDLSPAACHIAYNYTHPVDAHALKSEFDRIMHELQPEFDWLYGTTCSKCKSAATIQYTIWSDVYKCCRCSEEIVLWDVAVDHESGKVKDEFPCPNPHCEFIGEKTQHMRIASVPVVTNYECHGSCKPKRREHSTTEIEKHRIAEIEAKDIPYWYPTDLFSDDREMWRGGHRDAGIVRVSDFYTKRNLWALAAMWDKTGKIAVEEIQKALRLASTSISLSASKLYRYRDSRKGGIQSGTLYPPALNCELHVQEMLSRKIKDYPQHLYWLALNDGYSAQITTGSASDMKCLRDEKVDYIFTDPPFGSNIFYADCSIMWEAWLRDFSDVKQEAVWNKSLKPEEGGKTLDDYARIMAGAFAEMHRVLKPGRWASVVFSNSDDRVWQVIREGAAAAGFDLANTVALDKQQRSFKQIKGEKGEENVVGTDVIMNLHKKARVMVQVADVSDLDAVVLSFIRQHLEELPAKIKADSRTYSDALRATDALYSVALQELMNHRLSNRGVTIPYVDELCASAFKKIAGRWYLPSEEIHSDSLLAEIQDEPSAIAWIRRRLEKRPLTFAELVPEWRQDTFKIGAALGKGLRQILEENFWHENETNRWRIPTEAEKARMGDERTIRLKRRLRQLVEGKEETAPSDQELLELMTFAYQEISDPRAVVAIYRRLSASSLTEADRRRASRMYQAALAQTQDDYGTEWEDRQQRLI